MVKKNDTRGGAIAINPQELLFCETLQINNGSDDDEEWDDDENELWDEDRVIYNAVGTKTGTRAIDPEHTSQFKSMRNMIQSEYIPTVKGSTHINHATMNSVVRGEKKADKPRTLGLTKDSTATVDSVLDPRTILVLTKFIKSGILNQIFGCISTGKEANVYYAHHMNENNQLEDRAVKVYKTTILGFKDRARYVEGEFRFRRGYAKSNPRKMVQQWCEKELRNLKRIQQSTSAIRVPNPIEIRQNVLIMEFIGDEGVAAPRLKDAKIPAKKWERIYRDNVIILRALFQECKLVHGDLSEYNMLWHDDKLVVIDVSQSVEFDHHHALDFLKRDCININNFYRSRGCAIIPLRQFFDYVSLQNPSKDLDTLLSNPDETDEIDEMVFKNTWIPSCLAQVSDLKYMEKELAKQKQGKDTLLGPLLAEEKESDESSSDQDDTDDDDQNDSDEEEEDRKKEDNKENEEEKEIKLDGHKPDNISKAEWKKLVKEHRQEKLKTKIPKFEKKKHKKDTKKK